MTKFCLLSTYFICFSIFSQTQDFKIKRSHASSGLPSIIEFSTSSANVPNQENLGIWMINNLKASTSFKLEYDRTFYGLDGASHIRYKQYYGKFPVEYAEVILHQKNSRTRLVNGLFYPALSVDTTISVSSGQALQAALNLFPNSVFAWENQQEEKLLKMINANPGSTYFPKGSLVILNTGLSADNRNFRLAYKFDIYILEPHSRKLVYIDARTGEVLSQAEQLCSIDRVGIAHTKYSGTQSITCDSLAPDSFRLYESGRGQGIATMNGEMMDGINTDSNDFFDDDNIWDNVNDEEDEVATDAHWGSERTYDYYLSTFGRDSYNDSGKFILAKVHYGFKVNNAFWNGQYVIYGDGDNTICTPLTSIDICGHELTHAYTQYSAGLIYENESGAMNESFSDIFGKCVEKASLPSDFTWLIGNKIAAKPFRSMIDPSVYNMPKFYYGKHYFIENWDNGGVHFNSSLQNYWFYMLCNGAEGVREDDSTKAFKVIPIGMDKAAMVAYQALNAYLTPTSQFIDMSYLSIDAASQLFGENSTEAQQVQNAWFAVGLYDFPSDIDGATAAARSWSILPNPSSQQISFSNKKSAASTSMQMTDITGKLILSTDITHGEVIDVSSLSKGIYFITFNGYQTIKFVKE
jgi:bacillolysin